jgi:hypothetical protein
MKEKFLSVSVANMVNMKAPLLELGLETPWE